MSITWVRRVLLACVVTNTAAAAIVSTRDGLAIDFKDADASVASVSIANASLKLLHSPGGFYVADLAADKLLGKMSYHSETFPGHRLDAAARPSPTGVVIEGKTNDLWVRARIESRGEYLAVTGDLVNLRPNDDRAVILSFRLPIDATGAAWGKNLGIDEPIPAEPRRFFNGTEFHQAYRPAMSRLPIVTLSGDRWGLSLAQPMDVPRFFRLSYEKPYGFQIEYEFGLSPVTWKFRNRAPFQFMLFRHDPAWGLRSAFDRYYTFAPELFRKIVRDGMWIDAWEEKRKTLGDPADYGVVFNETGAWADADQRKHDVLSMTYIEPWCDHIEATPDGIAAMAKDTPENKKEARFGRGADLRTNALQLLNSVAYDRDGHILDPRAAAAGGFYVEGSKDKPYYRYLTNPDPELPTPFGGMNRAQKILAYDLYTSWGRQPREHQFEKDGVYYDSINGPWAGLHLLNFRRDHMRYVDFPLTFDHKTGKVAITHAFSAVEFLRYCTTQLHGDGRPTMGNANAGYFLPFIAPHLDMGGAGENYEPQAEFGDLREMRAQMHQKPLSFLNNSEMKDAGKAEAVMDALLLYACYPGAAGVAQMKEQRHLYRAYVPIYNALGAAGWEAIPYAHVAGGAKGEKLAPWCERFGSAAEGMFFAVRNPADAATELTLSLDPRPLGLDGAAHFDAITGCAVRSVGSDRVVLAIPPKWTAVVAVNRPDAAALAESHRRELAAFHTSRGGGGGP